MTEIGRPHEAAMKDTKNVCLIPLFLLICVIRGYLKRKKKKRYFILINPETVVTSITTTVFSRAPRR